ncbi:aminopeptidase P family protein [Candidatus Roizmanbacteria bacterium]|nr:aminopeptidase P family protein [Candidatus Roizmanbacteria bacterium]
MIKGFHVDALFITNFYNILYFTGFRTLVPHEREAFLLVTKKNAYIFSDGRYERHTPSPSQEGNFKLLTPEKGLMKHLQEIIAEEKIVKMGFEREDLKWSEYNTFQKSLGVELIPQDRVGVKIRAVKDAQEIAKIKKACEVGDECLRDISKTLREGSSEKEVAWNIEKWIRDKGYEIAFDPIVAVDANSAVPHYDTKNGNSHVKSNSIILIDMGVRYDGYNSDITRMFFMGKQPDEVIGAYETLLSAQTKTIRYLSKDHKLADVDKYCRQLITDNRLPTYPHSTGHGVGLEVHENPKVSGTSEETFQSGNIITIEPGIYLPGKWGMRIEDTVAITSNKQVKVLTAYPKLLQVL